MCETVETYSEPASRAKAKRDGHSKLSVATRRDSGIAPDYGYFCPFFEVPARGVQIRCTCSSEDFASASVPFFPVQQRSTWLALVRHLINQIETLHLNACYDDLTIASFRVGCFLLCCNGHCVSRHPSELFLTVMHIMHLLTVRVQEQKRVEGEWNAFSGRRYGWFPDQI